MNVEILTYIILLQHSKKEIFKLSTKLRFILMMKKTLTWTTSRL